MPKLTNLRCINCRLLTTIPKLSKLSHIKHYSHDVFLISMMIKDYWSYRECTWIEESYDNPIEYKFVILKLKRLQRWIRNNLRSRMARTTLEIKSVLTKFLSMFHGKY